MPGLVLQLWLPTWVSELLTAIVSSRREDRTIPVWRLVVGGMALRFVLALVLLGSLDHWPLAGAAAVAGVILWLPELRPGRLGLLGFSARILATAVALALLAAAWGDLAVAPSSNLWIRLAGPSYLALLVIIAGLAFSLEIGAEWVELVVEPFARQLPDRPDRPPQRQEGRSDAPQRGFPQGGRVIGLLERALIFFLVLVGEVGGVGFLVAAKSVFRFGELRERANRVEAEYILIGTLASFLWGLVSACATRLALQALP